MKIFLCWSGERSKKTAAILGDYIRQMIQAVEPWISTEMTKGINWIKEIGDKLEEIDFGIICLTKENINENWVLFEAGALSKKQGAHVCTFLLDLEHTDIKPPLAIFQHTDFNKEDVIRLIHTINREVTKKKELKLPEKTVNIIFDRFWPDLEEKLNKVLIEEVSVEQTIRTDRELLEEMLSIIRGLEIKSFRDRSVSTDDISFKKFLFSLANNLGHERDAFVSKYGEKQKKITQKKRASSKKRVIKKD